MDEAFRKGKKVATKCRFPHEKIEGYFCIMPHPTRNSHSSQCIFFFFLHHCAIDAEIVYREEIVADSHAHATVLHHFMPESSGISPCCVAWRK